MSIADSDEDKIPKSSFQVYRTEADSLFRSGKYNMAIKCYSQALELEPENQHCLVTRSRCYLYEGQTEKALTDAETSLKTNGKYPKGLFQKAEVYYIMGEFEKALVLYHRGNQLRPEMETFRLGIQKCEEAINNSVGDPETIKLKLDCDLSYFFLTDEKQNDRTYKRQVKPEATKRLERKKFEASSGTVKNLLGELFSDRDFLEKLLREEDSFSKKTENSDEIRELTVKGLNYLDSRCDFWQQQKPMYARRKKCDNKDKSSSVSSKFEEPQYEIIKFVVNSLDEIDLKQSKNEYEKALSQSESLLNHVKKWSEADLPNKHDVIANIYCLMGNSYVELGDYDKAFIYYEKDNKYGKKHNIEEAQSRSKDNLGRVYAKQGLFEKAIEIWEDKILFSQSDLESTWLHHEIGRCYFQLERHHEAIEYGEKAAEFAHNAKEEKWRMNAKILIAQANQQLQRYNEALEYFEEALNISRALGNTAAEKLIKESITHVNKFVVEEENKLLQKEEEEQKQNQEQEKEEQLLQQEKEEQQALQGKKEENVETANEEGTEEEKAETDQKEESINEPAQDSDRKGLDEKAETEQPDEPVEAEPEEPDQSNNQDSKPIENSNEEVLEKSVEESKISTKEHEEDQIEEITA